MVGVGVGAGRRRRGGPCRGRPAPSGRRGGERGSRAIYRIAGVPAGATGRVEYAVDVPDRPAAEAWAAERRLGSPAIEPVGGPDRPPAAVLACPTPGCGYRGPGVPPSPALQTFGCLVAVLGVAAVVASIFAGAAPGGPGSPADALVAGARCPKCRKWIEK